MSVDENFESGSAEADPLSRHALSGRVPAAMRVVRTRAVRMPVAQPVIVAVHVVSGGVSKHHAEPVTMVVVTFSCLSRGWRQQQGRSKSRNCQQSFEHNAPPDAGDA